MGRSRVIAVALGLAVAIVQLQACVPLGAGLTNLPGPQPGYTIAGPPSASQAPRLQPNTYGSASSSLAAASLSDDQLSRQLTDTLRHQRLPLVGADAYTDEHGNRRVVLYGYVATQAGKKDAVGKVRRLLNDPDIAITNRIAVEPDLLASVTPAQPQQQTPDSPVPMKGVEAYENQGQGRNLPAYNGYAGSPQPYAGQPQQPPQLPDLLSSLLPMLGMGSMGGIGGAAGGYNSYSSPSAGPYGSPYGGPYANPMTPYSGANPGYSNLFSGFLP